MDDLECDLNMIDKHALDDESVFTEEQINEIIRIVRNELNNIPTTIKMKELTHEQREASIKALRNIGI